MKKYLKKEMKRSKLKNKVKKYHKYQKERNYLVKNSLKNKTGKKNKTVKFLTKKKKNTILHYINILCTLLSFIK